MVTDWVSGVEEGITVCITSLLLQSEKNPNLRPVKRKQRKEKKVKE